jgi:hypothetical protein
MVKLFSISATTNISAATPAQKVYWSSQWNKKQLEDTNNPESGH